MSLTTLTWSEVGERWPDACVPWDRDVAPALTWDPVLVERAGQLWAHDERWHRWQVDPMVFVRGTPCRCLTWDGAAWVTHAEHDKRLRSALLDEDLRAGRVIIPPQREWLREFLGEWHHGALRPAARSGKSAWMRTALYGALARGDRVAVVTPEGTVDGREWLGLPPLPRPRFANLRRELGALLR